MMVELTFLGAMASPAYLLAEYHCEPDFRDPIKRAFELIKVCRLLKKSVKSVSVRFKTINASLKEFAIKMLELCQGTREAKLFLNQVDDPDDIDITRTMLPPRINFALKLHFKNFVLHDYCQQFANDVFYGKNMYSINNSGFLFHFKRGLMSILLLPLASLCHSFSKFGACCPWDLEKSLQLPINRMYNYSAAYLFFVSMVILNLVNPDDEKWKLEWNWYNFVGLPLGIGFLIFDLEQMSILASSVKISVQMNKMEAAYAKLCGFFGNGYFTYRFLGHTLYLTGITMEHLGYIIQEHFGHDYFTNLKLNVTHLILPYMVDDNESHMDDYESHYVNYHPVRIGICLQGIALLIVMTHLLQYLCLHPVCGIVYVGLRNRNFFQLGREDSASKEVHQSMTQDVLMAVRIQGFHEASQPVGRGIDLILRL